jgi:hypothetical protein
MRERSYISAREQNASVFHKLYDRLGVKRCLILGTTRCTDSFDVDDLVWVEYDDRFVATLVANPGFGKTVQAKWLAEQAWYACDTPILVEDLQDEWRYSYNPVQQKFALSRLEQLGIKTAPLSKMVRVSPYFAGFDTALKVRFPLEKLYYPHMSEWVGHSVFASLFASDSDSDSTARTVDALWKVKPKSIGELKAAYENYSNALSQKIVKLGSTISRTVLSRIDEMERARFMDGSDFDIKKLLIESDEPPVVDFVSSTYSDSKSSYDVLLRAHTNFLAAGLSDWSGAQGFPVCTKVREETDVGLGGLELDIIAREIKKERKKQHNIEYILQNVLDAPDWMLAGSTMVLTAKVESEKYYEKLSKKNPSLVTDELFYLDSANSVREWAAITSEGLKRYYPFSSISGCHKL